MKKIFFTINNKIRSIWWVLIFFILLVSFLFPAILIAQQKAVSVSIPIQAAIIILVTIICQLLRKESITIITGRYNFNWLKQMFTGFMIGAALMILPAVILTLFGFIHWQINAISFSAIVSGLAAMVFIAVTEELLFRGFIFQRLIESLGQWPAQLIIACLFLLTHINNPGMSGNIKVLASVNIFLASILFGLAFIKTRSLAMPLGIHFMANWVQGTVLGFGVSGNEVTSFLSPVFNGASGWLTGGAFGLEASTPGLISVIFTIILLYRWKPF